MAGRQGLTVLLEAYRATCGGTGSSTPQGLRLMHLIDQSIVVRTQVVTRQTVQVLRVAILCIVTALVLNSTARLTCKLTNRAEG
jgi:hypothetical protein